MSIYSLFLVQRQILGHNPYRFLLGKSLSMVRTLIFTSMMLLALTSLAIEPETEIPVSSAKPLAMMGKIQPLNGAWSLTRKTTDDGGQTWQDLAESKVLVRSRQNGMLLEEATVGEDDSLFHVVVLLSYDQYQRVFRQIAIEDYWGMMDVSEGTIKNGVLIMDNLESKTFYPMDNGRLRALRIRVELTTPYRTSYIDESYDNGRTWLPLFQLHYQLTN